jgi:hypothetical protein
MNRPARRCPTALAAAVAAAMLAAGCGTAAPAAPQQTARAGSPALSLNTSVVTTAGTWAVAVMGGSAAQYNNFWQLFFRPAGSTRWELVTPPGTADNGGLVLAGAGPALIAAFRPSQYLRFTPLTETRTGGQAWSSLSPVGAALASAPDALAAEPGSGRLLALLASGIATRSAPGDATWKTLTSQRALAATPAGRRCVLRDLTAAAFTPSGIPLLGGSCARPGTAGIFADAHGTWQAAGPAVPGALAGQDIAVLRLTRTAKQTAALLAAGTGPAASLLTAWSAGNGGQWALSPPLPLHGAALTSASFGPDGTTAVILAGRRGETITSAGSQWHALSALPPGTVTLAPGPGGAITALAVHRATLTVWQASSGGATWTAAQTISVPVQFGSSG